MHGAAEVAGHRLGHAQRVADGLLHRLGGSEEQRREVIGGQSGDGERRVCVQRHPVGGGEGAEDVTAAVGAEPANPGEADSRPLGEAAGAPSDGRTEWRRLQAQGSIAGGVAHIDRLQLSHPAWRMAADGSVDLQDGTLALTWSELVGNRKRGPVLTTTGPWRTPNTHTP